MASDLCSPVLLFGCMDLKQTWGSNVTQRWLVWQSQSGEEWTEEEEGKCHSRASGATVLLAPRFPASRVQSWTAKVTELPAQH